MLISFEGLDGSGKSTQAQLLEARLRQAGRPTLLVREPGGTPLSEAVRGLLLDPSLAIEPLPELLLFSAARAQLVQTVIVPALRGGVTVVCDRFFDSTTAYQGFGRGVAERGWLESFNLTVTGGLVPARTYLLEVPPEIALARRAVRRPGGPEEDRMEAAGERFYARVAEAYARIAAEAPERVLRLDGRLPVEALHERIWADALRLPEGRPGTAPRPKGSFHTL